jgi:hypothetical protein
VKTNIYSSQTLAPKAQQNFILRYVGSTSGLPNAANSVDPSERLKLTLRFTGSLRVSNKGSSWCSLTSLFVCASSFWKSTRSETVLQHFRNAETSSRRKLRHEILVCLLSQPGHGVHDHMSAMQESSDPPRLWQIEFEKFCRDKLEVWKVSWSSRITKTCRNDFIYSSSCFRQ